MGSALPRRVRRIFLASLRSQSARAQTASGMLRKRAARAGKIIQNRQRRDAALWRGSTARDVSKAHSLTRDGSGNE